MGDFKGALRAALLACTFFCSAASLAAAQTAPTVPTTGVPSREELDPSRRAPDIEQQRAREADLFARPESGPCPLANSALSFTLQSVTFNGATAATPEELASTYAGLLGRNVPVSTICEIRDRASDLFFSRGVLARVEIPEQRIEEGRLVLEVIEARVASVRVRGDAGPAQARVEGYLEQLRGLAPFDLQTAQRYLLLASDVPGVQLQAAIRPSAAGRGAVDLEVTLGRDEIDILVNVQNYGSESIGRWGGLLRADFNGFTPFGERSSLILYSTLDSDEQRIIQLIEEARVGDTGLLARGSFAYAKTKPGGELAALGLESDSVVAALEASYPLLRSRRRNLNLVGGFEYVDQETVFGSGPVLSDDKLRIISGRLEGSLRRPGLLAIDGSGGIEVRKGLDVFGASQAGEPTLTRTEGQPTATVCRRGLARVLLFRRSTPTSRC
jgi:hemolysin activation/secretion protein